MVYVLLGLQIAGFGLLLYLYLSLRSTMSEREEAAVAPPVGDLPATVGDLIDQLQRTADEIARELEGRATRLQSLVAEADRRLEGWEQTQDGQAAVDPVGPVAEQAELEREAEEHLIGTRGLVLQLANEGMSSWEIAQRTRTGREEVELLLQLHSRTRG